MPEFSVSDSHADLSPAEFSVYFWPIILLLIDNCTVAEVRETRGLPVRETETDWKPN